jgi:hypothetical protein
VVPYRLHGGNHSMDECVGMDGLEYDAMIKHIREKANDMDYLANQIFFDRYNESIELSDKAKILHQAASILEEDSG